MASTANRRGNVKCSATGASDVAVDDATGVIRDHLEELARAARLTSIMLRLRTRIRVAICSRALRGPAPIDAYGRMKLLAGTVGKAAGFVVTAGIRRDVRAARTNLELSEVRRIDIQPILVEVGTGAIGAVGG